jgi:hypothetical protein
MNIYIGLLLIAGLLLWLRSIKIQQADRSMFGRKGNKK